MPRLRAEVALGVDTTTGSGTWAWTDATAYARAKTRVRIEHGGQNEAPVAPPSKLTLTVDNTDGRWVARNPAGPWYGQIRRNVPIRILADPDVPQVDAYDTFTGRSSSSSLGSPEIGPGVTWSFSWFGGGASDFSVGSGKATMLVQANSTWRSMYIKSRPMPTDMGVRASVSCVAPTGGNVEPANVVLRSNNLDAAVDGYLLRVQVLPGNTVQTVVFRNGATIAAAATVPGLTHSAGTPIEVRGECYGSTVRLKVWQGAAEPTAWTVSLVDSNPIAGSGWAGIRNGVGASNTNTKPVAFDVDTVTVYRPPIRFSGYIDALPVEWDPSCVDSTVQVTASGFGHRLEQNDAPLRSALYRARTSRGYAQPVEYWPMEDGSGASAFASAVGGKAVTVNGQSPAASSVIVGSAPLPTFGAGLLAGQLRGFQNPPAAVGIRLAIHLPAAPASTATPFSAFNGAGSFRVEATATGWALRFYDNFNNELIGGAGVLTTSFYFGKPCEIMVDLTQNGTGIDWSFEIYTPSGDIVLSNTITGTLANVWLYWPTRWYSDPRFGTPGAYTVGHVAFYTSTSASPLSIAVGGWVGNTATNRIQGLCNDAQVPCSTLDDTTGKVTTLGPQSATSLPALLSEAANADGGILAENDFGLVYTARYQLYTKAATMVLDHALRHLADLKPVDDDLGGVNDITVSRTNGGSFRATDEQHIALYGRADDAVTLALEDDSQAGPQAYWRLSHGVVDDIRYPGLEFNLNAPRLAGVVAAWKRCFPGWRIQILNPPAELPREVIDLMLRGWTEELDDGGNIWHVTLNCTSWLPWLAVRLDDLDLGRISSGASTLDTAPNATTTSLSVATAAGKPLWTTGATSMLLRIAADDEPGPGEVVRATNITGASSPQTFTVIRGVYGTARAHSAGDSIDMYRPGVVAL